MEKPNKSYALLEYVTGEDYASYSGVERISMVLDAEADVDKMFEGFKGFMLAIGYHPNSIDRHYCGYYHEHELDKYIEDF